MIKLSLKILPLFFVSVLSAQNSLFVHYFSQQVYLNPAFTGAQLNPNMSLSSRDQYSQLPGSYRSFGLSGSANLHKYSSAIGFYAVSDNAGVAQQHFFEAALTYSYLLELKDELVLIGALQAGFFQKSLSYNNYIFIDQITELGVSSATFDQDATVSGLDLGAGLLLYDKTFWLGVSGKHLTAPSISLDQSQNLPLKLSLHGGVRLDLNSYGEGKDIRTLSLNPSLLYALQGMQDQLMVGGYLQFNPVVVGFWYNGSLQPNFTDSERSSLQSIIIMLGLRQHDFKINYSYNLGINDVASRIGGSHEISLSYILNTTKEKKARRSIHTSCPIF